MTTNDDTAITSISVKSSNADIVEVLKQQYGHLESGELRALLERAHVHVWTNDELVESFEVSHFEPPYLHVIRKENGKRGTVMFTDAPRFYFSFAEESDHE
jgi:hypothetical protein